MSIFQIERHVREEASVFGTEGAAVVTVLGGGVMGGIVFGVVGGCSLEGGESSFVGGFCHFWFCSINV
jgi:hypothetical protein